MLFIKTLEDSFYIYLIIINIIVNCNGYFYSDNNVETNDKSCFCEVINCNI